MSSPRGRIAFRKLQDPEAGVAGSLRRVGVDRIFDLRDGAVEILQPREGVAFEDQGMDVFRIDAKRPVGLISCVLEPSPN